MQGIKVGDRIVTNQSHQSGFLCARADVLAVVPEHVSSEAASLTYLAHLGLAALQNVRYQPGEHVAILGLGVIGLAAVAVAKQLGSTVIAIGNDPFRLEKARLMGADLCVRSDDPQLLPAIEAATRGAGVDVLITTANPWEAWRLALMIPRTRGRIAVLGFPGRSEGPPTFNPFEPSLFYLKQLTIVAAGSVSEVPDIAPQEIRFTLQRNMEMLLAWMAEGRLPLEQILTHQLPWDQLGRVYELAGQKQKDLVAAVLDWRPCRGAR